MAVDVIELLDEAGEPAEEHEQGTRGRRRAPVRLGTLLVITAVLVLIVGIGVRAGVNALRPSAADYEGPGTGSTVVRVLDGSTTTDIAQTLAEEDVVKSVRAFVNAAKDDEAAKGIQPGFYRVPQQLPAKAALAALVDPANRVKSKVTVPEGTGLDRTLALIAANTEVSQDDLAAAVKQPADLGLPAYAGTYVEGFLFPATYDIAPGTSAVDVLRMMTARFDQAAATVDLEAGAKKLGLTPLQVVTVASIIEHEVSDPADFGKVARVIYNRLANTAMFPTLGMESTVRYVLGNTGRPLTKADLATPSPYNTYISPGIPPSPIDNPGEASLRAALNPTPGNWTYFVSLDNGERTVFTADKAEFEALSAELQRQQAAAK